MLNFRFNERKAIAAALYVLKAIGRTDYHKLFKILYFADREHLKSYGRPVLSDQYVAMPYGPVPSTLYDAIKSIKRNDDSPYYNFDSFKKAFNTIGENLVEPIAEPDMGELSESDIECLDLSINDNKDLRFRNLTDKSHDLAWNKASVNGTISFQKMAEGIGADKQMIDYIKENIYDENLV